MTLGLEMITVDCTDPTTLAQWWAEAVGGSVVPCAAAISFWWSGSGHGRSGRQRVLRGSTPTPEPSLDSLL
jgi:hypothetical protein